MSKGRNGLVARLLALLFFRVSYSEPEPYELSAFDRAESLWKRARLVVLIGRRVQH